MTYMSTTITAIACPVETQASNIGPIGTDAGII